MQIDEHAIHLYGTDWCSDCKRSKKFLGEQRVPYHYIDVDKDEDGLKLVEKVNAGKRIIPTIVFDDGDILVEPSNAELARKLGLDTEPRSDFYDLIVVGGGPSGLAAAVYAAREGTETIVVEKGGLGGQAGITDRIDNYLGFAEGIRGEEFAEAAAEQARRFDVELLVAREVKSVRVDDPYRIVVLDGDDEISAKTILLATGATYRRLEVPGEEDLIGAGVHFCATCDGPFYKAEPLAVVGGGNSAVEESIFLARFASKVTLLVRGDQLKASQILADKLEREENVDIRLNTEVSAFHGDGKLEKISLVNNQTGDESEMSPAGVFIFIGLTPNSEVVSQVVETTEFGFVLTGHDITHRVDAMEGEREPVMLETSVPGVFAAGDVRHGSTKQVASAVGEGAAAALAIREYLKTV